MALVLRDRVKETTTTTGTGTVTLLGASTGYQSFSAIGNANTTYYTIAAQTGTEWEVGIGTYTASGTTLSRDTVLASSNAGSLVTFSAGTKDVFVTYPSGRSVYLDSPGSYPVQNTFNTLTAATATLTSGTISSAPTSGTDIVNKDYADSIASGLNYHQPVNYASVAALPTYTYNNGASGVGATITANANGALSFGGGSPTTGQRLLVKDEVGGNQPYNGVYTVTQAGSAGTPFILTRATDYDTSGTGTNEIDAGDYVLVISGTNASTAWVQQTPLPITVGTTAITFLQFNAPITYNAGTGLNLSPATTFNISNTGVAAATYGTAAQVPVFAVNAQGQITSVTNTSIAINGNQITAGTVSPGYGGTGFATYAVGDLLYADTTTTLAKLADVATGNALISGGVTTAPSWGKIGLTTHVSGTLPIANGGTNTTATPTSGGITYGTGTAQAYSLAGTVGQVLTSAGASAPTWVNQSSIAAGTASSVTNSLTINNGGAGAASGSTFNGSSAVTISYNTVGASPLAGSSSLTTTGTVTSGTWSASFGAVSGANLTSLTAGNLSGTIPSAVLGNSTHYIGTTAVALNRASANQALTGILSVQFPGSTSGTTTLQPSAIAGTTTITMPATTGTMALTSDIPTVNNGTLTMNVSGTGLSGSATFTANQSGASTFTVTSNATNANTASTIVARDASGNFSAGTITASLSGNATTATTLATARSIGGTSFNGSADITPFRSNTIPTVDNGVVQGSSTTYTTRAASSNPNQYQYGVNWEFKDAAVGNSTGNFTGLLTLAPWVGTTASTGDPNYQISFNPTSANSTSPPVLRVRAGIDTTWGSWATILHSSNYTSYAPSLTGTGASGTWGISISGNAATATTATNQSGGTVNATTVTITSSGYVFAATPAVTTAVYGQFGNSTSTTRIGLEGSVAGNTVSGSLAYNSYVGSVQSRGFHLITNNTVQATVDASGNFLLGTTTSPAGSKELVLAGDYIEGVVAIGNSGTAQTLSLANGTVQTVTMTGNCTFTMPGLVAGKSFILIASTGSGSFTASFTSVKWPNNTAPTLTTTASRWDIFTFVCNGSAWYGNSAQAYA